MNKPTAATVFYAVLIGLLVAVKLLQLPGDLPVHVIQAALLIAFTLCNWAFGLLVEPLPTVAFFLLVMLFEIAPADVVFSGFSSTAWWLVFGGSVLGVAISATGLGGRIAAGVFSGQQRTYNAYLWRVALLCVGLAFLMPSTTGRILLLTPIVMALARQLGYAPGSNGHTGLVLCVAACSYMPPTSILPANLPNSVLLGAAESIYGIHLAYAPYLLAHFPVLGVAKTVLIVWVIAKLFPETQPCLPLAHTRSAPLAPAERRLLWVLVVSVMLFMTDFIHGISPAWVSLGAAVVCLWPAMSIVTAKHFSEGVHVTPLIFVAGFLGLGAVVANSGIGVMLGRSLLGWAHLSPDHPAMAVGVITAISTAIGLVTILPSLPAVLTPLASEFASASGLSLSSTLMLQVPVFGLLVFPYQCPPIVLAMTMGHVSLKHATALFLLVSLLTVVVLFPLDYAWWKVLGLL